MLIREPFRLYFFIVALGFAAPFGFGNTNSHYNKFTGTDLRTFWKSTSIYGLLNSSQSNVSHDFNYSRKLSHVITFVPSIASS